jgi:hypothetical protein
MQKIPNTADSLKVPFEVNGNSKILPSIDGAKAGSTPGSPNSQSAEFPSGAGTPTDADDPANASTYD